jgi:hypothetical protein
MKLPKNLSLTENGERLEISAPWLGWGARIALVVLTIAMFTGWLLSERDRMFDYPATVLVPLPIMLSLAYLFAALATASSRITIDSQSVNWTYGGLPLLPPRRLARADIECVAYWQQTVGTRHGTYTTGVAGLIFRDGLRPSLIDTFATKEEGQWMAGKIAAWMNAHPIATQTQPVQVREAVGLPAKIDKTYYKPILFGVLFFCALLLATAVASEYFHI